MLEIFAIPYLAVTGLVGWLIFEPLFRIHDSQPLSAAKLNISDLLVTAIPVGVLLAGSKWMFPVSDLALWVQLVLVAGAILFAAASLIAGLYLIPKTSEVTSLQRMAVVGIIVPFGSLMTVGWVAFLSWVCFYSIMYLIPAMVALGAITALLRLLTLWVCRIAPGDTH